MTDKDTTVTVRLVKPRRVGPMVSAINIVARDFFDPYLSWSNVPSRGNVFPYAVQASRVLRREECGKIAAWCSESIGEGFFMQQPGGSPNGVGSAWIGDVSGMMHFRDETHMVIFVIAFTSGR